MLILSRRAAECICLGDDIVLTIVAVGNDKVRIGVKAPPEVRILRNELEVRDNVQKPTIAFPTQVTDTESTDTESTDNKKSRSRSRRKSGRRAA